MQHNNSNPLEASSHCTMSECLPQHRESCNDDSNNVNWVPTATSSIACAFLNLTSPQFLSSQTTTNSTIQKAATKASRVMEYTTGSEDSA
jgi:hypothetical protein